MRIAAWVGVSAEQMLGIAPSPSLAARHGQGWLQIGELLLAFVLSASVGLERQLRGKSAGLRTQTIVGTSSALFLLISKYGFADVLATGYVVLDPSRVAAQIVSGIGFLGAGLILTRGTTVRGLTTAAAVWETAAIGMAAGAGLPLLAAVVTLLHFVAVFGFTWVAHHLPHHGVTAVRVRVSYLDRQGALRQLLALSTQGGWTITGLRTQEWRDGDDESTSRRVAVTVDLSSDTTSAHAQTRDELLSQMATVAGVTDVELLDDDDLS